MGARWHAGDPRGGPGPAGEATYGFVFFILELIVKIWLKLQMFSFSGTEEGLVRQVALSRAPRLLASTQGLTTVVLGPDRSLQTTGLSSEEKMRSSARKLQRWRPRRSRKGPGATQREELLIPHPSPPCYALQ